MSSAVLHLESAFVSDVREQFRLSTDRAEVWTLFAARTGAISFRIEAGPGAAPAGVETAIGGLEGDAAVGDVVICPPGARFRRRMLQPTAFLWARFDTTARLPAGRTPIRDLVRFTGDIDRLAAHPDPAAGARHGVTPEGVAAHHVADIVLLCLESHTSAGRPVDRLAETVARVLTAEFARPDLALGEIATRLSISPAALSRRFRAAYGTAPVAFLRDLRLQHARRLLLETTDPLTVVARACGYADPFYFTRVCTRAWGMSPTQFRRRHRF